MGIPLAWVGLVDDAAIFPPGNAPLHDAAAAHVARRGEWWADLVGPLVVRDTDVPLLRGSPARLSVVVTGGAGQIAGPTGLCRKLGLELAGLEIALRDLDDLPGNARRVVAAVDAARSDEALGEGVPVYVELPQIDPSPAWLAAADELAAAELRLKYRTGGVEAHLFPTAPTLAAWIDAALDRETPFKCTAGLHDALRHRDPETGFEHHGFLNVLTATTHAFDGATRDDVVAILDEQGEDRLVAAARDVSLDRGRRWFTSFGSCSVTDPLKSLVATGFLEDV
jgi:hypothetical protein